MQATLSAPATGLSYTTTAARTAKTADHKKGNGRQAAANFRAAARPALKRAAVPAATRYPPTGFQGYLAAVMLHPDRIQIDRTFIGRINGNRFASIVREQPAGVDFLQPTRLINGHVHFANAKDLSTARVKPLVTSELWG